MASESPGVNASQFFVTLGDEPQQHLDRRFQVFGQVLSGMEVRSRAKTKPHHWIALWLSVTSLNILAV
jgi:cyclophilin family peptidyl-prolyl cis-trans isomerase